MLGDGHGHEVSLAGGVGEGFHLDDFEDLHFIHELGQWESPSLGNSLKIFHLFNVDVDGGELSEGLFVLVGDFFVEGVDNSWLTVSLHDSVVEYSLNDEINALV